ncbi:hypothetical protein PtB15_1B489 [Puccinia triticina]|nr:hypothetical protein PtB15_1B489 [Puccinia triticina]
MTGPVLSHRAQQLGLIVRSKSSHSSSAQELPSPCFYHQVISLEIRLASFHSSIGQSTGGYWPAPLALLRSQLLASSSFSIPSDTLTVAYLRLEAIQFYASLSPKNKRISQWSIINNQLKFLRRQEPIYQQAFFGLMAKKDSKLFGSGQAYFRDLETNVDWEMPIDKHIRQRAEHLHKSF